MPSWQETLIISAGMLEKYYGEVVACNASGGTQLAVWPAVSSGGSRAEFVVIRPGSDVYMAVDETAGIGAGPLVGKLEDDTNYGFPISPAADTLQFKAVSSTCDVQVNWVVQR